MLLYIYFYKKWLKNHQFYANVCWMSRMFAKRFYCFDTKFCFDRNSNYIWTIDDEIEHLHKSCTKCGQFAFLNLRKRYPKQFARDTYYRFEDEVEERKKMERKENMKTVVGMMMNDFIFNNYLSIIYINCILQLQTLTNI